MFLHKLLLQLLMLLDQQQEFGNSQDEFLQMIKIHVYFHHNLQKQLVVKAQHASLLLSIYFPKVVFCLNFQSQIHQLYFLQQQQLWFPQHVLHQ